MWRFESYRILFIPFGGTGAQLDFGAHRRAPVQLICHAGFSPTLTGHPVNFHHRLGGCSKF